jgi:hypothetical protein
MGWIMSEFKEEFNEEPSTAPLAELPTSTAWMTLEVSRVWAKWVNLNFKMYLEKVLSKERPHPLRRSDVS